jgi:hypothetical protein
MRLNADFSQRVVVKFNENDWVASPMAGVSRKLLDRIGDEVARATTIVRFDPNSAFSPHTHVGGEEFIVLDGVFQDEHGDFPPGSYVRNPPTSRHTPSSDVGTTILVKLHQFDANDRRHVRIDTTTQPANPVAERHGVSVIPLFQDQNENVRIEVWSPNSDISLSGDAGYELLVLEGDYTCDGDQLSRWDWMRVPVGQTFSARAGDVGARIWVKSGHLAGVGSV